jgi:hypothetical protein
VAAVAIHPLAEVAAITSHLLAEVVAADVVHRTHGANQVLHRVAAVTTIHHPAVEVEIANPPKEVVDGCAEDK